MDFAMDKFSVDELTGGTELAKWIAENCEAVSDDEYNRIVIQVWDYDWDSDNESAFEIQNADLAWVKEEMGSSRDIWVRWTVDDDGNLLDWWISGDDC